MRNVIIVAILSLLLAACQGSGFNNTAATGALVGAAGGAAIGGIAGGGRGALIGAGAGAAAGAIIGAVADRPGYCYAYNRYGERVVVRC